jgi:hypothetical protein
MTMIIIAIILLSAMTTHQFIILIKLYKMHNYDKKLFALHQEQRDIETIVSKNFDRLMKGEITHDVYDGSLILAEYIQKEIDNFKKINKEIVF